MKKSIKIIALCLVLLLVIGFAVACKSDYYDDEDFNGAMGGADYVPLYSDTTRKVVYTATLSLEIAEVGELSRAIEAKCKELGGYTAKSNESYDGGECYYATATYRIPTDKLSDFLSFCEKDVRVTDKSVSTRDITSSSISANAERDYLNQKKSLIEDMMKDDTLTAKEKLEMLDSLAQVNKEIQALEEQIKANTSSYEYSTVHINVSQSTTFMDVFMPILILIIIPVCAFCGIFFGIRGIKKRQRRLGAQDQQA